MLAIGIIAAPAELLIPNSPPGVIAAAILAASDGGKCGVHLSQR